MKATKEQISDWKKQHGKVYAVHVYPKAKRTFDDSDKNFDKSEKLTGYFRKPTAAVWGEATKHISKDIVKYQSELFVGCWVGGDQEIYDNDELRLSAAMELSNLFEYRITELEEL